MDGSVVWCKAERSVKALLQETATTLARIHDVLSDGRFCLRASPQTVAVGLDFGFHTGTRVFSAMDGGTDGR